VTILACRVLTYATDCMECLDTHTHTHKHTHTHTHQDARLRADVVLVQIYEGWNFNSGNYLFTTDTK